MHPLWAFTACLPTVEIIAQEGMMIYHEARQGNFDAGRLQH